MARVTNRDCIGNGKAENHFELTMLAALHTRVLDSMSNNDSAKRKKNHVRALKQIASDEVKINVLRQNFLNNFLPSSFVENISDSDTTDDIDPEVFEFIESDSENIDENQFDIDSDSFSFEDEELGSDDEKN